MSCARALYTLRIMDAIWATSFIEESKGSNVCFHLIINCRHDKHVPVHTFQATGRSSVLFVPTLVLTYSVVIKVLYRCDTC